MGAYSGIVYGNLAEALLAANTRTLPMGLSPRDRSRQRVQWRIDAMRGNMPRHLEIVGDKWVPIDWSDDEYSDTE